MEQYERNNFRVYRATVTVHLGPIARDIQEGEHLETDGSTVKYDGETFTMPGVKGCIKHYWFVPENDQTGNMYVSRPANLQMHSAVPNRDGTRETFQMGVTHEDHHVVGSVQGASLGAQSDRTKKGRTVRAAQQAVAPLQEHWQQQHQYREAAEDLNIGGHQPLMQSDPRYMAQRVNPNQLSPREMVETMTGQHAMAVVELPPTQKSSDESTRRPLTQSNKHMVNSAMTQAENRSQARVLQSRQIASEKLRQKEAMRGQAVGVNGLSAPGGDRYQGGDFNQQEGQVVRTVSSQQPQYQQPPVQQLHQPAPPMQVDPVAYKEYQDFLAFQQMRALAAQQTRQATQANQAGLAQAHMAQAPQQATQVNWAEESAGVQWAARAKLAVERYGSDAHAIEAILGQEASAGARKEIRRRLGWPTE